MTPPPPPVPYPATQKWFQSNTTPGPEGTGHERRGGSIGRASGLEIQWMPWTEVRIPSGAQ